MSYTPRSFDLTVARARGSTVFDVAAPELHIRRVDSPITLRFDGGEPITFTEPDVWHTLDCRDIGTVSLENAAGSGTAELYWSRRIAPLGKVDATVPDAVATPITILGIGSAGTYTDQVTGLNSGAAGVKFNVVGTPSYAKHAVKKFHGMLLETATQHENVRINYEVPIANLFSPDVLGLSLARYNGRRWVFELDVYCEQVYTPSASDISHFIGIGGVNGAGKHPGFGLWRNQLEATWRVKLWDNTSFIFARDTGVACLDSYSRVKIEIGVDAGIAWMETSLNGNVVDKQVGAWPAAMNVAMAGQLFHPMARVYRQAAAPDESRMYTNILNDMTFSVTR
jgi:hypothetical protein